MSATHIVTPGVGADFIWIGTRRADVRMSLGEFRTFRRGDEPLETDQFVEQGVMATYDEDVVTDIEITPPARALLGQHQLIGLDLSEAVDALRSEGLEPVSDGEEFIEAPHVGLALFCVDRVVDGVWVGTAEGNEEVLP